MGPHKKIRLNPRFILLTTAFLLPIGTATEKKNQHKQNSKTQTQAHKQPFQGKEQPYYSSTSQTKTLNFQTKLYANTQRDENKPPFHNGHKRNSTTPPSLHCICMITILGQRKRKHLQKPYTNSSITELDLS
jgi:hypothetical protein